MTKQTLEEIVFRHRGREGALLPILHEVQEEKGHVSEEDAIATAQALNLSRAEVWGVVSFYQDFRHTAPTRPSLKLCRGEACQARGVDGLVRAAGPDERVEIETVYCLGLCSIGPAALAGSEVYGRLDEAALRSLLNEVAAR